MILVRWFLLEKFGKVRNEYYFINLKKKKKGFQSHAYSIYHTYILILNYFFHLGVGCILILFKANVFHDIFFPK
jgi:hypothetical protein